MFSSNPRSWLVSAVVFLAACHGGGGGGGGGGPTPTYTIGGMVTGLAGSGLVLQNNAGNNLAVSASGSFAFSTALASGASYSVTVLTQPSNPSQTCSVTSGGSGTVASANVMNVQLSCVTNSYTVGGTVTGLDSSGLVLQNNAGDDLAISGGGAFAFATQVASGAAYAVTIKTQPNIGVLQNCSVANGGGTVTGSAIANVAVTCVTRVAKFMYVPNASSQTISGYAIDASTGSLTAVPGSPFATAPGPQSAAAAQSGKFLYVACVGSATEPPRISGYSVDATTGALTELAGSPFDLSTSSPPAVDASLISNPRIHPSGAFGYVAVVAATGQTQLYGGTIDPTTGELVEISGLPLALGSGFGYGTFDGPGNFYYQPTNAMAPLTQGEIAAFQVNSPSGVLTPIGTFPTLGDQPVIASLWPGGSFMLASNILSGSITVFGVSGDGTLAMVGSPVATGPAGSRPGLLMFHRRLNIVYVTNLQASNPSLAAFQFDPASGALTPLAGSPFDTNGAQSAAFLHPSGKFLYQPNTAAGTLQRFAIDQTTGVPALVADVTTAVGAPSVLIPDPSGRYVYVLSQSGQNLSSYSADQTTGALTLIDTLATGTEPKVPAFVGLQ